MDRKNLGRTLRDDTGHDASGERTWSRRQDVYGHPGLYSSVQRLSARKSGVGARDREGDRVRTQALRACEEIRRLNAELVEHAEKSLGIFSAGSAVSALNVICSQALEASPSSP